MMNGLRNCMRLYKNIEREYEDIKENFTWFCDYYSGSSLYNAMIFVYEGSPIEIIN